MCHLISNWWRVERRVPPASKNENKQKMYWKLSEQSEIVISRLSTYQIIHLQIIPLIYDVHWWLTDCYGICQGRDRLLNVQEMTILCMLSKSSWGNSIAGMSVVLFYISRSLTHKGTRLLKGCQKTRKHFRFEKMHKTPTFANIFSEPASHKSPLISLIYSRVNHRHMFCFICRCEKLKEVE